MEWGHASENRSDARNNPSGEVLDAPLGEVSDIKPQGVTRGKVGIGVVVWKRIISWDRQHAETLRK